MKRIKVGIIYGGNSVEHEISIISAIQAIKALDKIKYEVIPLYITKDNKILSGESLSNIDEYKNIETLVKKCNTVKLKNINNKGYVIREDMPFIKKEIDVIYPVVHGKNVEDGSLKFLIDSLDIPSVYSSISSLSLCQDKVFSKMILDNNNFPVLDYVYLKKQEFKHIILNDIDIDFPCIVKPATLGSSIGIKLANNKEELHSAINTAFCYDDKVMIEKALNKFKEVNCSAFRYKDKIYVSEIERVYSSSSFLSYNDKYENQKGMETCKRELPANISEEEEELIKQYTKDAYELFDCSGVVRIDYMIGKDKKIYLNEINSIPGSLSFYLWEASNIRFDKLLDMLIEEAISNYKEKNKLINTFNNFKIFNSNSFKLSLK